MDHRRLHVWWMNLNDCQRLLAVSNQISALRVVVKVEDRPRAEIQRALESLLPGARAF